MLSHNRLYPRQPYKGTFEQSQEDSYCILCEVKREHCNFVRCIRYVHIRGWELLRIKHARKQNWQDESPQKERFL